MTIVPEKSAGRSRPPRIVVATIMRHEGGTGVQSHVQTFEEYLRGQDRPFEFVSPFSSRSPFLWPMFGVRRAIHAVSTATSVWWYRYWHARFLESSLRRELARHPHPTVVYAQCPVSADVALRVRSDQPVVMAAHFNISQADEWAGKGEIAHGGRMFRAIRGFEDRILARLDAIVYVSAFSRRTTEAGRPWLADVPAAVVPNALHLVSHQAERPTADLITVGSLESRKNHAYLLEIVHEAAKRGRHYSLSVVGDGPARGALERQCALLGLSGQVHFLGHRPDATALMPQHRVYCHTARMESFGIVLAEAMSQGLPVLAADVGGIAEVMRPGIDGEFWPLDDPAGAADVLIRVMDDEPLRESMGRAGRLRADKVFSVEVVGAELLAFLDSVQLRTG